MPTKPTEKCEHRNWTANGCADCGHTGRPTAVALRAATEIWNDVDTFDLPSDEGLPALAEIIDQAGVGELVEALQEIACWMRHNLDDFEAAYAGKEGEAGALAIAKMGRARLEKIEAVLLHATGCSAGSGRVTNPLWPESRRATETQGDKS